MKRFSSGNSVERFFEFSLLGLLASGYLAIVGSGYLDAPTIALTATGLIARALIILGLVELRLSPTLINALTLAYVGFYPLDYLYFSREFLPATVHLVFFLAVAKLLTAKTDRDYFYLKIIAFLELLAASVLSANANFFVFLAAFFGFGVATFASSEIRRSVRQPRAVVQSGLQSFHRRLVSLSLSMVLGILAMTGVLFFLLPRTARAAFQHLVNQRYHLAGFSNEVTLGQIGEIKKRSTPVMHTRVHDTVRPLNLKWRGAALSRFDGRRWFNPSYAGTMLTVDNGLLSLAENYQRRRKGVRLSYDVHLKGVLSDALFFAGIPEYMRIAAPLIVRTSTDSFRLGYGPADDLQYVVSSYFPNEDGSSVADIEPLAPAVRDLYLSLPPLDGRIAPLSLKVAGSTASDFARSRAVEQYLRKSFGYTTELLSQEAPDPLAHFLFVRRKGHCEYFASSMAVMLRTLGIPSRVVTGFQGGMYNPISGWYLIRSSDAHSWVEAWFPGLGWMTFDPTPPDLNPPAQSIWARVNLYIDALEMFWQDWVLNYDLDRQLTLAASMESSSRRFRLNWWESFAGSIQQPARFAAWVSRNAVRGAWLLAAGVLIGLLWRPFARRLTLWLHIRRVQRGGVEASDATILYLRMLAVMKKRGFEKPDWITPHEFARLLPPSDAAHLVAAFTSEYNALRFGGRRQSATEMMSLLDRLEQAKCSP